MKFFIDTANIEEIKSAYELGIISGVTTNPSLISREGESFNDIINKIVSIVDGPISGEIKATTELSSDIIKEAREIATINSNMVVKIPMTKEGLKATSILSKEGIKINVTLIFSPAQALLAAKAGATYVSPFLGRLDDIAQDGITLIADIIDIFRENNIQTEIIAASIRNPIHVIECAKLGCDIATVPYKVINQLIEHPLTDKGIKLFKEDYLKSIKK